MTAIRRGVTRTDTRRNSLGLLCPAGCQQLSSFDIFPAAGVDPDAVADADELRD